MADGAIERSVDGLVQKHFRLGAGTPGIAVLIMYEGEVLLAKGYGMSDVEKGIPLGPDSVFDLASVSKHFTCLAALLCVTRELLDLDDPVRQHLPELSKEFDEITVRHLLTHTSGLPDLEEEAFADDRRSTSNGDLVQELACGTLGAGAEFKPPGDEHSYNNVGYQLAAAVIEAATGENFGTFMTAQVFQPLGMNNTRFPTRLDDSPDARQRLLHPRCVRGYAKGDDGYEVSERDFLVFGDGNVFTCLNDLAVWERAMFDGFSALGLASETAELMFENNSLNNGEVIDYGLGWSVEDDSTQVDHGGSWDGTATHYQRSVDEQQFAIVLLSNIESLEHDDFVSDLYWKTAVRVGYESSKSAPRPARRRPQTRRIRRKAKRACC